MQSIQVSEQGQLTIPADITERLGIAKGVEFRVLKINGGFYLKPISIDPIEAIQGILEGKAEQIGWKSEEDALEFYNEFRRKRKNKCE